MRHGADGAPGRRRHREITIAILAGQEEFFEDVRARARAGRTTVAGYTREALRRRMVRDGLEGRMSDLAAVVAAQGDELRRHCGTVSEAVGSLSVSLESLRLALAEARADIARLEAALASSTGDRGTGASGP